MPTRLVMLLRTIDLLSRPSGATINELAENLDIDRRSVYRWKDVLEELGIPLYEVKEAGCKEKKWRVLESYLKKLPNLSIPDIALTLQEIIALHLLKGEAKVYRGTEIEERMDAAFRKLAHFVPGELFERLNRVKSLLVPTSKFAKDYSGKEKIIECSMDAMLRKMICYVEYHSFSDDRVKNFKIDPLCFFENNGGLYVFVRATSFGDIRTLAVERIQSITSTEAHFDYPEDFDPEALLDSAFDIVYGDSIEAKIRFSAEQARYVKERRWARDQKITELPDASIILEIKTSGWWHVRKWLLSFGAEAEVLEPGELRDDIAQELKRAAQNYR